MRFSFAADQGMAEVVQKDIARAERGHTQAMRVVAAGFKAAWRDEIRAGGLGSRLSGSVRSAAYPKGDASLNAAAMVWTKAPEIVASHDSGTVIRSSDGFWLAIPLPAAGRGRFGRRMTPGEYEQRRGVRLTFVYRPGKSALLVADNARINAKGLARKKGGRRRKDGILSGAQSVPVFVLVPQVRLKKRTDLIPAAERVLDQVPGLLAEWIDDV